MKQVAPKNSIRGKDQHIEILDYVNLPVASLHFNKLIMQTVAY